ncbi:hypothetical protein JPSP43_22330 [Staphylococcus pseudintermedius]|uniref:type II toxin-antitoxin system antitoxin TscA n=1 Tax=Staphylococcus pseudintermedius TaxID=283734 RepID=UPI001A0BE914|nr:hypothetical protein [Staphylococcus pseudintermedius]EGQ3284617.1 hypothetical protein [Staphylococcus pseudintermedius]MCE5640424.1 hypothetical protein [Staphylococcus pseudintermedius]MCE5753278.1 hypothetical protein [Staphylococcus pseudintermedius]MDK3784154.1 hypothetical protein [Staphylococcus pseudintermedius]
MNEQQTQVLEDIYNTLIAVSDDVATEYKHKVEEGVNEWYETVSREKHLESIIQWAVQQIENNFEVEEK